MPRSKSRYPQISINSFGEQLKQIDMFFDGKDQVHKTMHRLVKRLNRAKINYAIVGGLALNAHFYR